MNRTEIIKDRELNEISEKVKAGTPVSGEDILHMLKTDDILGLGVIADSIRKKFHGNKTFYGVNCNLNRNNFV